VVVTGGASGIGRAISRRLAARGAAIAIVDLNRDAARDTATSIEADGGSAIALVLDVTDRSAIDRAVDEVQGRLGAPTILVNSAGVASFDAFLEIAPEDWNRLLLVNLTGTFQCCQAFLPAMIDEGWGRIVNISSSSVHSGVPRMSHYVAAKSGVVGLTKSLALEFAPAGITVNTIAPGFIDTPMSRASASRRRVTEEQALAGTPVGRRGQPEDVAAACEFLVSDEAGYITGQIIGVNGGRNT
jgi:NAD(P)-dependent dehydrogenase (short-subunit alcohol dehydrogenase family)